MQNQELKDIHVVHAPHPKRVQLFIISLISLATLVGIVFVFDKQNDSSENISTIINNEEAPAIDSESVSDSGTYTANGFTFDYPTDYKVEEKERGIYIISKSNETDITIDNSQNEYFNIEVERGRNNLTEQVEKILPADEQGFKGGIKMFGKLKNGDSKGTPILSAYLRNGEKTIIIEHSGTNLNEAIFDLVVNSTKSE